ncbi:MAG: exodeoxyribonuclease VII small subunit [Tannerella sp.]|jgi:exodeoxyribonuclease VII small subunit|nr:exodeoxyribonuclease VII small subunit [Tannerella sp.]
MEQKKISYSEAVEKLRVIVEEIERGELDVDILSAKVKEATGLIKLCKDKLFKADEDVKQILEEIDG